MNYICPKCDKDLSNAVKVLGSQYEQAIMDMHANEHIRKDMDDALNDLRCLLRDSKLPTEVMIRSARALQQVMELSSSLRIIQL